MSVNSFNVYLMAAAVLALLVAVYYLFRWYVPRGSYYDAVLKRHKVLLWYIAAVIVLNGAYFVFNFRKAGDFVGFVNIFAVFVAVCWNAWRLLRPPGKPESPSGRCGVMLKAGFKYSCVLVSAAIAVLAGIVMSIMIQDWVSPGYTKHRNPDLVETRTVEGFTVKLVRWTSDNPVLRCLDWMFLRLRHRSFIDADGKTVAFIQIDLSEDEETGREIKEHWQEYKGNARLARDDPKWDFDKQVIYNYLRDSGDKANAYFEERQRNTLKHELQHARDYVSGAALFDKAAYTRRINAKKEGAGWVSEAAMFEGARAHDEKRAGLAALMRARSAFGLIDLRRMAGARDYYGEITGHHKASKSIIKELEKYSGAKSDKDLAFLPVSEINKGAAEIFAKTP